ncbi:MAG TPA: response regulator, partial [Thermodesulfobacteriota bacterium]|nr:response regulator [Thermodesulfobacteriota bacterium]
MEIGKKHIISLIVAAPSALFREGIRKILEPEKDIEIIAEASTQLGIIPLVEQKKPDVLFIDAAIPNLDIVKILELIKEKSAETKVLLLLHTVDEKVIINAISLGVRGYL